MLKGDKMYNYEYELKWVRLIFPFGDEPRDTIYVRKQDISIGLRLFIPQKNTSYEIVEYDPNQNAAWVEASK